MAIISTLLPGDKATLHTNYPEDKITWSNLDEDFPIITSDGIVHINTNPADKCFGGLDITVRATLQDDSGCDIDNVEDIQILVNPMYPTPNYCGPDIVKWRRLTKEFRVITKEFEGGCDETHIKNKVPIIRWEVTYQGLKNIQETPATRSIVCPGCQYCRNGNDCVGCSDYDIVATGHGNCLATLRTSNRLDDFWNYVYGTYKRFNLYDWDTGEIWYNCRFENSESDHVNRRTSTSRTYTIVWKPCCEKAPMGGTCSIHGMRNYTPNGVDESCCTFEIKNN